MPVVRTFGTSPCLMLIWHEAHPSSPPILLQMKGTGRAPKWLSRANIPGGKPIANTTRWQTMGQNHDNRTDWIQVKQKKKKRTRHAWEAKPIGWLHIEHQPINVAFIDRIKWGIFTFLFKLKKKKNSFHSLIYLWPAWKDWGFLLVRLVASVLVEN